MHKFAIILLVIAVGGLLIFRDMSAKPGTLFEQNRLKPAPDVTITDLDGNDLRLHDLKERVVLLNIWATWCTPCIKEMPDLLALSQKYPRKLSFIALSTDRDVETIKRFFDKLPEDVRRYIDADNVIFAHDPRMEISKGAFGTSMYPESFVINEDMRIVRKISGVIPWQEMSINDLLQGESKK